MLQQIRTRWAERKKREQELDEQYAAEERAFIDDPNELDAELDQAQDAGRFLLFGWLWPWLRPRAGGRRSGP